MIGNKSFFSSYSKLLLIICKRNTKRDHKRCHCQMATTAFIFTPGQSYEVLNEEYLQRELLHHQIVFEIVTAFFAVLMLAIQCMDMAQHYHEEESKP